MLNVCFSFNVFSQGFIKYFGGNLDDIGYSVIESNDGGVVISKLNSNGAAYTDSNEQLKLGQQIVKVNGQNLVGATYSETVSAFRKTEKICVCKYKSPLSLIDL